MISFDKKFEDLKSSVGQEQFSAAVDYVKKLLTTYQNILDDENKITDPTKANEAKAKILKYFTYFYLKYGADELMKEKNMAYNISYDDGDSSIEVVSRVIRMTTTSQQARAFRARVISRINEEDTLKDYILIGRTRPSNPKSGKKSFQSLAFYSQEGIKHVTLYGSDIENAARLLPEVGKCYKMSFRSSNTGISYIDFNKPIIETSYVKPKEEEILISMGYGQNGTPQIPFAEPPWSSLDPYTYYIIGGILTDGVIINDSTSAIDIPIHLRTAPGVLVSPGERFVAVGNVRANKEGEWVFYALFVINKDGFVFPAGSSSNTQVNKGQYTGKIVSSNDSISQANSSVVGDGVDNESIIEGGDDDDYSQ